MTFQENETVELKAIVVEDIKKEILPNLNVKTEQKEPENTGYESSTEEEKVIALAKEQGFVAR